MPSEQNTNGLAAYERFLDAQRFVQQLEPLAPTTNDPCTCGHTANAHRSLRHSCQANVTTKIKCGCHKFRPAFTPKEPAHDR